MATNSVYKPNEKSTTKNLDIWLKELSEKVTVLAAKIVILESANTEKDSKISNLEQKNQELEEKLKNTLKGNANLSSGLNESSAQIWKNFTKNTTANKQLCNLVSRENAEIQVKEKNVMIFGLVDECDDNNKVKEILEEIEAGVDLDEITVKRFNSSKNPTNSKPPPIQVALKSKEDKLKVLKAAKKLKTSSSHKGIFINPDYTKLEMEATKKLNVERNKLNENLPNEENGKKYGLHKFGNDESQSKFFWGIRDFQLTRIKIQI